MSSQKRNAALVGCLVLLVTAGLYVSYRSQRSPAETLPLDPFANDDIVKVSIQSPSQLVVVERRDSVWWLTSPVSDVAEPSVINPMVSTLRGLSIGSIISENKDKYESFQLNEAAATHLQVFVKGKTSPAVDMFIGKQAVGYGSCYIRFPGKAPVYMASNLPNWMLLQAAEEFRKKVLLPAELESVTRLDLTGGKFSVSLVRSSATWSVEGSSVPLAQQMMVGLQDHFNGVRVVQFIDKVADEPRLEISGLDKPFLVIKAQTAQGSTEISIGNKKIFPKGQPDLQQRYGKVKDRPGMMLLSSGPLDDLLKLLKTLPKSEK